VFSAACSGAIFTNTFGAYVFPLSSVVASTTTVLAFALPFAIAPFAVVHCSFANVNGALFFFYFKHYIIFIFYFFEEYMRNT